LTEVRLLTLHFGWILEAMARESAAACDESITVVRVPTSRREFVNPLNWNLETISRPKSHKVLFVHHETLARNRTDLQNRDARLLLTHFDKEYLLDQNLLDKVKKVSRVIVQNVNMSRLLIEAGIERTKIEIGYGAVNRSIYHPLKNGNFNDYVLIVGDCKPRKNPERISELIKLNPQTHFLIHGTGWEKYLKTESLSARNLKIVPFSKERNPTLMREASLLLTLSLNEGGPIPVLEALASGTPVLASDTGFCREVIPEEFGSVVSHRTSIEEISSEIVRLSLKKSESWNKDLLNGKYSWRDLGNLLYG
jgi:glycosyltransferase involved in cell wall biosynthesis